MSLGRLILEFGSAWLRDREEQLRVARDERAQKQADAAIARLEAAGKFPKKR